MHVLVRQGWREFRTHPAVSAAAVLMLALGIAGAVTMFAMLGATFQAMVPPGIDASRLGRIVWTSAGSSGARAPLTSSEFVRVRDAGLPGIERLAAYTDSPRALGRDGATAETKLVSAAFFQVLGFRVVAGRSFTPSDEQAGQAPVAIISESLIRQVPTLALGRPVVIDEASYTVVGIVSDDAWYPARGTQVWLPLLVSSDGEPMADHVTAVFRLRDGETLDLLQAQTAALGARLTGSSPNGRWRRLRPVTLQEEVSTRSGAGLVVLLAPAIVVLLIACANVTNLLLARATRRETEVAVRAALGATRRRLVAERLAESVFLAAAGGGAGLALAILFVRLVRAWVASASQTAHLETLVRLDIRAVGFALLVTLTVPLLSGLIPALKGSCPNLTASLKHGEDRRRPRRGPYGGRDLLVVVEIGLAVVLVVFAGMLTRFFQELGHVAWGFDAHKVLAVGISTEPRMSVDDRVRLASALIERAGQVPGVSAVSLGSLHAPDLPRDRDGRADFEGCAEPEAALAVPFQVGDRYFATLGLRVLSGRPLTADDRAAAAPVAVISARHAARCWPGREALGRRVKVTVGKTSEWVTVVGVAPDAVTTRALRDLPQPVYLPLRPGGGLPPLLLVRAEGRTDLLVRPLVAALKQVDPRLSSSRVSRIDERLEQQLAQAPAVVGLIAGFGAFSLLLAGLGVFAVTSYMVAERTREFGIRIALGASRAHVLCLVLRQAVAVILIGAVVSIAGTLAVARATFRELADLAMTDVTLWGGVAFLMALVAVGASLAPARRATRVQPVEALRQG